MKRRQGLAVILTTFFFLTIAATVHAVEIKVATLAPKGSSWDKIMTQLVDSVQTKTGGAVTFKVYAGGVMGDEVDVVKKLKINQVQGAGFTGMGLGAIAPELRVMELPMLFESYEQVDKAFAALESDFRRTLDSKGYVLLGWAHPGFVVLYSKKPIAKKSDMEGAKVWVWQGDPIASAMTKALGLNAVPLSITDVLTSLQTGMIDTVYAPPMAAVALQWYTRVKHITDNHLVHSMGALILKKQAFNSLSPAHRKILKDESAKFMRQLTVQTRAENDQSLQAMTSAGIQKIAVAEADKAEMAASSQSVWAELSNNLYPAALLDKVKAAR